MTIDRNLFAPSGPLALAASAYASPFEAVAQPEPKTVTPDIVATLYVRGPLVLSWSPDSPPGAMAYEWIQEMAKCYFAHPQVKAVVMRINSPGGVVSGVFETSTMLRELAVSSGKPLYAYVEGQCCSAAYALSCAATRGFFAAATSEVGSIGVIHPLGDQTKKFEREGLRFTLVTSGERKADGNPLAPVTDDVVAAKQAHVDELAEEFFAHVSAMRPQLSVETIRGFQAATFTGRKAAGLRLVDSVSSFDRVLALAANADSTKAKPMKLKAAAQAIVDDDKASDEDKAEAKAYLASLEKEGDDDKAEGDDEKSDDDSGDDDKAEGDDEKSDDKKSKDDAKAMARASAPSAANETLGPRLARIEARMQAEELARKRNKLLKGRPDLTSAQVAAFSKVDVSALPALLAATPVNAPAAPKTAASPMAGALAAVSGEQASTQTPQTASPGRSAMRARMGLVEKTAARFELRGDTLVLDLAAPIAAQGAVK